MAYQQKAWSKALPGKVWPNANHCTRIQGVRQVVNVSGYACHGAYGDASIRSGRRNLSEHQRVVGQRIGGIRGDHACNEIQLDHAEPFLWGTRIGINKRIVVNCRHAARMKVGIIPRL